MSYPASSQNAAEGRRRGRERRCIISQESLPEARLVLVPRHPNRAGEIVEQLAAEGLPVQRLTELHDGKVEVVSKVATMVDAVEAMIAVRAVEGVEVPPRQAVGGGDDGGPRPEQRPQRADDAWHLMRFQRQDDGILGGKRLRPVGRPKARRPLGAAGADGEAIGLDGGQVRPAGNEADVGTGACERVGQQAEALAAARLDQRAPDPKRDFVIAEYVEEEAQRRLCAFDQSHQQREPVSTRNRQFELVTIDCGFERLKIGNLRHAHFLPAPAGGWQGDAVFFDFETAAD